PLLEGASVNGARGVIINIPGGLDLSLMEVSEAWAIVQEAADEDANIIFGAVVDPALQGRVKITVIATGFTIADMTQPLTTGSPAKTPVDMTMYAEQTRVPTEAPVPIPAAAPPMSVSAPRLSLNRRPLVDLWPAPPSLPSRVAVQGSGAIDSSDRPRITGGDADADLGSAFDVPAFLRRQEG